MKNTKVAFSPRGGESERRLLAIDDDPFYRHLYSFLGKSLFTNVDVAESVNGIDAASLNAADVIILDLDMPNTDGIHFLTEVLPASVLRNPDLEIIICSGLDSRVSELARRAGRLVGVNRIQVLAKPFTASALRKTLSSGTDNPPDPQVVAHLEKATVLELRDALHQGDIVPYWQPQVSAQDGRVTGLEVLSRWHHPQHGVLLPGHFLDAMESDELAVEYALGILEIALSSLGRWARDVNFSGRISLNAPPAALVSPTFAGRLMQVLDTHQFPEQRLVLEVTEHAASLRDSHLLAGFARIMMHNIQLSIDDFGTGHSSLDRLGTEAFSEIKIDRSFIAVLGTSDTTTAITRSIIQAAKTQGLRIVAEGVSSAESIASLTAMGCTELQGSYFAMPMPEDQLVDWLNTRDADLTQASRANQGQTSL
jgi:EAL domain-containing protein (putative c-di-GMP-specific phosphodiesterase class I)